MSKEKEFKTILVKEGLADWRIKKTNSGGGLVIWKIKTILLQDINNKAMFLHELSHVITKKSHDSIFADKFTELVDKYFNNK